MNENKKNYDQLEIETIEKLQLFLNELSKTYRSRDIDSIIITSVICDCLSNFCTNISMRNGMNKEKFFNLVSNTWDRNVEFIKSNDKIL